MRYSKYIGYTGEYDLGGIWSLQSQIDAMPRSGLVFHLDAANKNSYSGSGSVWTDLTGNNQTSLVNSPTFSTTNLGYFTFNGTSQEATTTITHTGINATSFTFFGWFRTSTASGKKIIGFQNNQTGTTVVSYDKHVYVNTSGQIVFGVWNGSVNIATSTTIVSSNTWYSFAALYNDGGVSRIAVNGVVEGSVNAISTDTEGYIRIGGYALTSWPGAVTGYFPGDIAILGRYNKILSSQELLQLHNASRTRFGV